MKYIEYHNLVDREGWDQGPWDSEPDKIQLIILLEVLWK